jgi:hypothetical protein
LLIAHLPVDCDDETPRSSDYRLHTYPFSSLGAKSSHVFPHYVVFKTGQALQDESLIELSHTAALVLGVAPENALVVMTKIREIYQIWCRQTPSPNFATFDRLSPSPHSGSGASSDERGKGPSSRQQCRKRARGPQADPYESHKGDRRGIDVGRTHVLFSETGGNPGPVVRNDEATLVCSLDDRFGRSNAAVFHTDTRSDVMDWVKKSSKAADEVSWESAIVTDGPPDLDSTDKYAQECTRSPDEFWDASWIRRSLKDLGRPTPDTSKFSSNDWALFDYSVYLTRPLSL